VSFESIEIWRLLLNFFTHFWRLKILSSLRITLNFGIFFLNFKIFKKIANLEKKKAGSPMMGWLLSKTQETRTFSHFENIFSQKKKRWSG